jgi:hypothetical protein
MSVKDRIEGLEAPAATALASRSISECAAQGPPTIVRNKRAGSESVERWSSLGGRQQLERRLGGGGAVLATLVLCAALAWPRPVLGQDEEKSLGFFGPDGALTMIVAVEVVLGVGGIISLVGNAVHIERGVESPLGWRVMGWTTGILNVAWGGLLVSLAADSGTAGAWVWGLSHVALGAADIVLALVGARLPPATQASIAPTVVARPDGSLAPVLQLTLLRF